MKTRQRLAQLTLVTLVAAALAACQPSAQAPQGQDAQPAPQVSVAKVISERVTEWDEFTGRLEAPQTVDLRPRVSGYINEVLFQEGALVTAGDTLFQIDPAPFETTVNRLQAELLEAQSQAKLAAREFERGEHLYQRDAMSQEALDNRRARQQQTQANVESKRAALAQAQLNLDYTQVKAPISGRVSRALITKGNYVTAGQSELTTLVSTDRVYAYFDADEQTFLKYKELARDGERPSSNDAKYPVLMGLVNDEGFPHIGHIDFIDNQVDQQTGTIRGRAVFDNADGLFTPGLFARVKLVASASYSGILVNDKAIGTDLNHKFVLVLDDDNRVQYRAVTLGKKLHGLQLITEGLAAGDTIVVNGLQRVRPGTQVSPAVVSMTSDEVLAQLKTQQQRVDQWLDEVAIAAAKLPATNPG